MKRVNPNYLTLMLISELIIYDTIVLIKLGFGVINKLDFYPLKLL